MTYGFDSLRGRLDDLLPQGSLRARFAKGAFWSAVGIAIAQVLTFAASVLVVRMFGREMFGEFSMVRSTVGMLAVFAHLSMALTATKYVAEFRRTDPARAGRMVALTSAVSGVGGVVAVLALILVAPVLAARAINAPHLAPELRIGAAVLWLEAMIGAQMGVLAGLEAFRAIALVNLYRGLLNFPVMVAGAYGWGLRGAVVALVIVAAGGWVINLIVVRRVLRREGLTARWREMTRELPLLWAFALPASLSGVIVQTAIWVANAMLARRPDGYSDLGMFNAANTLRNVVLTAGAPLGAVLLPMLSSREGLHSDRVQRTNILAAWVLGLVAAVPAVCFPELFGRLFGRQFAGGELNLTLVLIVLAAAVTSWRQGLARVLAARNLMWWGFMNNLLWVVLFLGAMLVARFHGSIGMSTAYLAAYVVGSLVFVPFYIRRGLVAREIIWSWAVFRTWVALAAAAALSLLGAHVAIRAVAALALSALVVHLAWRLLRTEGNAEPEAAGGAAQQ